MKNSYHIARSDALDSREKSIPTEAVRKAGIKAISVKYTSIGTQRYQKIPNPTIVAIDKNNYNPPTVYHGASFPPQNTPMPAASVVGGRVPAEGGGASPK